MSFALRGIIVSLAFFAVLYSMLSLLVVLAWRGLESSGRKLPWDSANFRFGLRLFPYSASLAVTLFLTIPSFWRMESASLDEDLETFVLALCALQILGAGFLRVLRAQARTTRAVSGWIRQAHGGLASSTTSLLNASSGAPPLLLVGVLKPRVLISDAAVALLSENELQVAVRHELRHKSAWDNLRKVLLSATPFPGMGRLENAWLEAAEISADASAVTNRQEALDLAATLIKLSRSSMKRPEPALATGLLSGSSSIGLRVDHLLQWRADTRRFQYSWPWTLLALLTLAVAIACNYGATLAFTHQLTELLVP